MRTLPLAFSLVLASCSGLAPTAWTPELVATTQQTFELPGEWNYTARSGADFGKRCDVLFDADHTYRKSCRPPVEETGQWAQAGEWDGHTFRIRLHDRVDLIAKRPLPDIELVVVVESPAHDRMTLGGEPYERR